MIVRGGIRDAEVDRDHVEKGGFRQRRSAGAQIGTGVEAQFISPGGEIGAFEKGAVGAAIGIGVDGLERRSVALPE